MLQVCLRSDLYLLRYRETERRSANGFSRNI